MRRPLDSMARSMTKAVLRVAVLVVGLAGSAQAQQVSTDTMDSMALAMLGPSHGMLEAEPEPPPPRVLAVLGDEVPLATMYLAMDIPTVRQSGDKTNCGPTTAAMTLAAFQSEDEPTTPRQARELRDLVGEWSWQAFPLRQMRMPGYDPGMTTREMMRQSLDAFGASADVGFEIVRHPWIPLEAWSVLSLKRSVVEHRPVVVLAEAATLWNLPTATGLHWVVVSGLDDGRIVFNDPADGTVSSVPIDRFWTAWRLSSLYRSLPMVDGFEALVADRSLMPHPTRLPVLAADALRPLR